MSLVNQYKEAFQKVNFLYSAKFRSRSRSPGFSSSNLKASIFRYFLNSKQCALVNHLCLGKRVSRQVIIFYYKFQRKRRIGGSKFLIVRFFYHFSIRRWLNLLQKTTVQIFCGKKKSKMKLSEMTIFLEYAKKKIKKNFKKICN